MEKVTEELVRIMEGAANLDIPLKVEPKHGNSLAAV